MQAASSKQQAASSKQQEACGEIEIVPANNALMSQGMDRGKGKIDMHAGVWIPNPRSFHEECAVKKGAVDYSKNSHGARTGFAYPDISWKSSISRPSSIWPSRPSPQRSTPTETAKDLGVDGYSGFALQTLQLHPESHGSPHIRSRDLTDPSIIHADYLAAEADRHAIHQDRRALRGAHINGKRLAMSGLDRPVGAFLPAQWPCIGQLRRLTPRQRLTYRPPANVDGKQYRKSSKSSREYRGRYGPRHPELDPLGRRKARTPWPIDKSRHPRLLSSNRQENHS